MVRSRLSEMPGKLDHATVVAFKVGVWPSDDGMYLGKFFAHNFH